MTMIKRGHSDTNRPSVISSTKKCLKCGTTHDSQKVCPVCKAQMSDVLVESRPDDDRCPGGICRIDDK
jgi:rubrerythrin